MQVVYERCCGLDVHKIIRTETGGSIPNNTRYLAIFPAVQIPNNVYYEKDE